MRRLGVNAINKRKLCQCRLVCTGMDTLCTTGGVLHRPVVGYVAYVVVFLVVVKKYKQYFVSCDAIVSLSYILLSVGKNIIAD